MFTELHEGYVFTWDARRLLSRKISIQLAYSRFATNQLVVMVAFKMYACLWPYKILLTVVTSYEIRICSGRNNCPVAIIRRPWISTFIVRD